MKVLVAMALCFGLSVYAKDAAKDRSPAQVSPYPGLPTTPGMPSTPVVGGSFSSEDVVSSGVNVSSVLCITSASPYAMGGIYGNDVTVKRVAATSGTISYEVFKGSKFVGACPAVQVISR